MRILGRMMRRRPLNASNLEACVLKRQFRNFGATNIGVGRRVFWLPNLKPGPVKQGCVASLLDGTSLKKSKALATVCGKPLFSTSG